MGINPYGKIMTGSVNMMAKQCFLSGHGRFFLVQNV